MIYLACALYKEAEKYIKAYGLKPLDRNTGYQVFKSDELTLIITGYGSLRAAIALTDYFAQNKPSSGDVAALIGSAGLLRGNLSDIFAIHTIIDSTTGKIAHTDLQSVPLDMATATLITFPNVVKDISDAAHALALAPTLPNAQSTVLCDMEGYGVYESLIRFFKSSDIYFIKFVSDKVGEGTYDLSNTHYEKVMEFLNSVAKSGGSDNSRVEADAFAALLGASKTMTHTIYQLTDYYSAQGGDAGALIKDFCKENDITEAVCKKDGLKLLERFKSRVLDSVSL